MSIHDLGEALAEDVLHDEPFVAAAVFAQVVDEEAVVADINSHRESTGHEIRPIGLYLHSRGARARKPDVLGERRGG